MREFGLLPFARGKRNFIIEAVDAGDDGGFFDGGGFEFSGVGVEFECFAEERAGGFGVAVLGRKGEVGEFGFKIFLRAGVCGEGARFEFGEERVPDDVHDGLHILDAAGDGDDGVVLGEDDAVLAEGAVAAVGVVAAAPELVSVALVPIAGGAAAVGGLAGGGGGDPGFGEKLFAIPVSFFEIKLAEFGDVFGADVQAEAAHVDALFIGFPDGLFDVEGFEEARLKVIDDGLADFLLNDGGKHETGGGVVDEVRAWFVRDGKGEEIFYGGAFVGRVIEFGDVFVVMAGRHGEEVADAHSF